MSNALDGFAPGWFASPPNSKSGYGQKWEIWTAEHLRSLGAKCLLQTYHERFDILVNGVIRVEVKARKSTPILSDGKKRFIGFSHNWYSDFSQADYLVAIIVALQAVYIIPTNIIKSRSVALPLSDESECKYASYREAWSLILNHGKEL